MDDVWGNAWAQPEEDVAHGLPTKPTLNDVSSWSFSAQETGRHEEADVGLPSWSTGELNWTEPTGQASLWSPASPVDDLTVRTDGWGASATLKPKLDFPSTAGQSDDDNLTEDIFESLDQTDDASEDEQKSRNSTLDSMGTVTVTGPRPSTSVELSDSPPPIVSPQSENPERADAFGSFEDGIASELTLLDEGKITWASPVRAFDDASGEEDTWGSAWGSPNLANRDDDKSKDEWFIAREQQAKRDRSVPPELVGAILDRLNDLTTTLWSEKDSPHLEQNFGNWRDGMANVVGLEELMQRSLPETPSQPPIQFSRSHTARALAKSIKLSKNLPIVRNSPMSHLFTAKSLAAWELAVKNKVEVHQDDIPVGWKAVEPEGKGDSKPALVEKKSSGIFSFFSKRASVVPSPDPTASGTDSKRSSLSREVSSDMASASSLARNSTDASSLSSKIPSSVSSLSSALPAIVTSPTVASSSTDPPASPPALTSSSQAQMTPAESQPHPAPSAVSRFLNRFSRSRSDSRFSSTSPQSSIALSTDDLEFLSDIVPSHSDDADENEQLNSLAALVSSPALPVMLPPPLAPPPLIPPPLAPPPRSSSTSRSPTPQPQPQPLLPAPLIPSDSKLTSVLGDLASPVAQLPTRKQTAEMATGNGIAPPMLPPPLPPPLSPASFGSLSKPPTPSPLSGGAARARQSMSSSTSPPTWSRVSSATPPPKVASPRLVEPVLRSFSPLSPVPTSAGSSPVVSPVSGPKVRSDMQTSFSPLSLIPPPPIEKSPNRAFAQPSANFLDDSDEFSNFRGHETASVPVAESNHTSAASMFNMNFGTTSNRTAFSRSEAPQDDPFGDFMSHSPPSQTSSLRSPESPTSPPPIPPPLPSKHTPANLNTLHIRKPSAADHDAAARLVERAAARSGRWPAPPSPLPNPLPPPPSSGANSRTSSSNRSLLELNNGAIQAPTVPVHSMPLKPIAQITSSAATTLKPVSPPPLLPPPSSSSSSLGSAPQASLMDFEDFTRPTQAHPVKVRTVLPPPASSAGSTGSGLSAQDLSFFEGL